jgi:hypothetical protein
MDFPLETIVKATSVAEEYKKRYKNQTEKAIALYCDKFIELSYGVNDAIKQGLGAIFFHEARTDVDCFSKAGVDYIMAEKLELEPELYIVRDMQDIEYGKSLDETSVYDHTFITVKANGKRFIIDRQMGLFGEVNFLPGRLEIISKENRELKNLTTRFYRELEKISKEDYLSRIKELRKPEGARLALANCQVVKNKNRRVYLEYLDEERTLVSSLIFSSSEAIIQRLASNYERVMLYAPLADDGTWLIKDAFIRFFSSKKNGWRIDQEEGIHTDIKIPYDDVISYLRNLSIAAKNMGRKTSLEKLSTHDSESYFKKLGFDLDGSLLFENGVDPITHSELLEKIKTFLPKSEPEFAIDSIHQTFAYKARKFNNISEENPKGYLYTENEKDFLMIELLTQFKKNYYNYVDLLIDTLMAKAKLDSNFKEKEKKSLAFSNSNNQATRFQDYLSNRGKNPSEFDEAIDFALFQKEHPLGKIRATEEELQTGYMIYAHHNLTTMLKNLPILEIKTYQPGLRKILSYIG